jgi:hypothetical protein
VTTNQRVTATSCVIVIWGNGSPRQRHACRGARATRQTHTFRCTTRLKIEPGAVESRRQCSGSPVKP